MKKKQISIWKILKDMIFNSKSGNKKEGDRIKDHKVITIFKKKF